MEKRFTDIMDELTPEELDALLDGVEERSDEVSSARINAKVGEKLFGKKEERSKRKRLPRKAFWAIAACIAVIIALGVGTYAYAAEVKEYNAAKEFFMENGLDASGLTRGEIKSVYRDITTESFTYGKTAEVIAHSFVTNSVPGYELSADLRSKEEVEAAWLEYRIAWFNGLKVYPWNEDDTIGTYCLNHEFDDNSHEAMSSDVEKRDGDETVWSVHIDGVYLDVIRTVSDGVIVWGRSMNSQKLPFIAKISDNGKLLWGISPYIDSDWWHICTVSELNNCDIAVIGISSNTALTQPDEDPKWNICYIRYSADGELKQNNKAYVGNGYPRIAAPFGNGCIVALDDGAVFSVDENADFSETAVYSEEGRVYNVKSMIEFGGSLYLSCYSFPDNGGQLGIYGQTSGVQCEASLDEIMCWFDEHKGEDVVRKGYSDELFMQTLRDNFKAILLRIDPDDTEPEIFYSIDGAFGSRLEISEDNELVWYAESIGSAGFFPMLNSHSFEIVCSVTRCVFDQNGQLHLFDDTGELSMIYM